MVFVARTPQEEARHFLRQQEEARERLWARLLYLDERKREHIAWYLTDAAHFACSHHWHGVDHCFRQYSEHQSQAYLGPLARLMEEEQIELLGQSPHAVAEVELIRTIYQEIRTFVVDAQATAEQIRAHLTLTANEKSDQLFHLRIDFDAMCGLTALIERVWGNTENTGENDAE